MFIDDFALPSFFFQIKKMNLILLVLNRQLFRYRFRQSGRSASAVRIAHRMIHPPTPSVTDGVGVPGNPRVSIGLRWSTTALSSECQPPYLQIFGKPSNTLLSIGGILKNPCPRPSPPELRRRRGRQTSRASTAFTSSGPSDSFCCYGGQPWRLSFTNRNTQYRSMTCWRR